MSAATAQPDAWRPDDVPENIKARDLVRCHEAAHLIERAGQLMALHGTHSVLVEWRHHALTGRGDSYTATIQRGGDGETRIHVWRLRSGALACRSEPVPMPVEASGLGAARLDRTARGVSADEEPDVADAAAWRPPIKP